MYHVTMQLSALRLPERTSRLTSLAYIQMIFQWALEREKCVGVLIISHLDWVDRYVRTRDLTMSMLAQLDSRTIARHL